jgi:transketolase
MSQDLLQLCTQIRRDILRMVYDVQSGHPGGSLGCVEYFVNLFFRVLQHDPKSFSMDGIGQDLFFLSNGHISPVYYSTLARAGFFPIEELKTFRRLDSRLQGHPATAEHLEGVRVATGSLGQGLSVAIGSALAKKLNNDPHLVYVLCGDGEMQEGQIWEAALFGAHHVVDNLIVTIDLNFKQIDGDTRDVINSDSLAEKWRAFNWIVLEEKNGNDLDAVYEVLLKAKSESGKGKPIVILLHTVMGKGVDFMEDKHEWHGSPPNQQQFEQAMAQLHETIGDY